METLEEESRMAASERPSNRARLTKGFLLTILLFVIPAAVFVISFGMGRYYVSPDVVVNALLAKMAGAVSGVDSRVDTVLFAVRLPRLIAAILAGSALSAAGCAYQGMFRNPLVSPDVLGATAGASFGAALGIYMSMSLVQIQAVSFVFGIGTVAMAYMVSLKVKRDPVLVLVLSGILMGTIFSSGTSIIKYIADPYDKLPAITFWLMGSLSRIAMDDLAVIGTPIIIGIAILLLLRWKLNIMTLGEDEARSLGINTNLMRFITIIAATGITSAVVSVSGQIGWVGLVVPHLARLLVGPDFRKLLPVSIVIGATYLLLVDDIARTLLIVEIPIGILTSLVGAPFFLLLIMKGNKTS